MKTASSFALVLVLSAIVSPVSSSFAMHALPGRDALIPGVRRQVVFPRTVPSLSSFAPKVRVEMPDLERIQSDTQFQVYQQLRVNTWSLWRTGQEHRTGTLEHFDPARRILFKLGVAARNPITVKSPQEYVAHVAYTLNFLAKKSSDHQYHYRVAANNLAAAHQKLLEIAANPLDPIDTFYPSQLAEQTEAQTYLNTMEKVLGKELRAQLHALIALMGMAEQAWSSTDAIKQYRDAWTEYQITLEDALPKLRGLNIGPEVARLHSLTSRIIKYGNIPEMNELILAADADIQRTLNRLE